MKNKGMWLLFLIVYDLQSMGLILKNPTVCIINNLPLKTKHINKLTNHNIQLLLFCHYNLPCKDHLTLMVSYLLKDKIILIKQEREN